MKAMQVDGNTFSLKADAVKFDVHNHLTKLGVYMVQQYSWSSLPNRRIIGIATVMSFMGVGTGNCHLELLIRIQ